MVTIETAVQGQINVLTRDMKYEQARSNDNPGVRQEFLDALDLEDVRPYIERVIYDPRKESFIEDDGFSIDPNIVYMITIPPSDVSSLFGYLRLSRPRGTIKVFRGAFHKCENLDEFLSGLIDHEGYHLIEHCTGKTKKEWLENEIQRVRNPNNPFTYFSPEELEINSEIRARENQLKMIRKGKRNCSPEFVSRIEEEISHLYLASAA